jgi:hypothetical protein
MIEIKKAASGQLQCRTEEGDPFEEVRLRPCFPLSHPGKYLSLCEADGEGEVAFVSSPEELDAPSREALGEALASASFLMEVVRIDSIEDGPALREWRVETTRGPRRFLTQLDAWPRELGDGGVLIEDVSEDLYLVRDPEALDAKSRERLWFYVG